MDLYNAIHRRRSHRISSEIPSRKSRSGDRRRPIGTLGTNLQGWEITVMAGKVRDRVRGSGERAIKYLLPRMEKAGPGKGTGPDNEILQEPGGRPDGHRSDHRQAPRYPADLTNIQSGAALLQNLLLAADAEGLGTCWMTGAHYLETEILKFLGKTDKQFLAISPIGYSDKNRRCRPQGVRSALTRV